MGTSRLAFACVNRASSNWPRIASVAARSDHEEAKIGGDELVAAPPGVKLPAEPSELGDKRFFYKMMDVFRRGAESIDPRGLAFGALRDIVQSRQGLLDFRGGENADRFECFSPRAVYGDFIRQ